MTAGLKSVIFSELPAHETLWSITTGRDGNIYAGLCGELTGGGECVYRPLLSGKREKRVPSGSRTGVE